MKVCERAAEGKTRILKPWLTAGYMQQNVILTISFSPASTKLCDDLTYEGYLCQNRGTKLLAVRLKLEQVAKLPQGRKFVMQQGHYLKCINESAARFYHGAKRSPERPLWPDGCSRTDVTDSLTKTTCEPKARTKKKTCMKLNGWQKVMSFLGGIKRCKTQWVDPVCKTTVDKTRQKGLLQLTEAQEKLRASFQNTSMTAETGIAEFRNEKVNNILSKVVTQVDVASNIYIGYSIVCLIFARPLRIMRRRKRSQLLSLAFGLSKPAFVLVIVVAWTLYESGCALLQVTDVRLLVSNMYKDPCWVDPEFSKARSEVINEICSEVATLQRKSNHTAFLLDDIYYNISRFGLCVAENKAWPYPSLRSIDYLRNQYRSGKLSNPATCNTSALDERSSFAPKASDSNIFKVMVQNGLVAQLLLKVTLTKMLTHAFGLVEPMTMNAGRVEIWGEAGLSLGEETSLRRFCRDWHLLPFLLNISMFIVELSMILYATIFTSGYDANVHTGSYLGNSTKVLASHSASCRPWLN